MAPHEVAKMNMAASGASKEVQKWFSDHQVSNKIGKKNLEMAHQIVVQMATSTTQKRIHKQVGSYNAPARQTGSQAYNVTTMDTEEAARHVYEQVRKAHTRISTVILDHPGYLVSTPTRRGEITKASNDWASNEFEDLPKAFPKAAKKVADKVVLAGNAVNNQQVTTPNKGTQTEEVVQAGGAEQVVHAEEAIENQQVITPEEGTQNEEVVQAGEAEQVVQAGEAEQVVPAGDAVKDQEAVPPEGVTQTERVVPAGEAVDNEEVAPLEEVVPLRKAVQTEEAFVKTQEAAVKTEEAAKAEGLVHATEDSEKIRNGKENEKGEEVVQAQTDYEKEREEHDKKEREWARQYLEEAKGCVDKECKICTMRRERWK